MPKDKIKTGRPTKYTKKLADEICNTIATSSTGIRRLCMQHEHWPNPDTIYRWIKENKEFSDQYARAKRHQIEVLINEIIEIADDVSNDTIESSQGTMSYNKEHINRSRLRIDTRKWLASKLLPKLYGDKVKEHDAEIKETEEAIAEIAAARKAYKESAVREY